MTDDQIIALQPFSDRVKSLIQYGVFTSDTGFVEQPISDKHCIQIILAAMRQQDFRGHRMWVVLLNPNFIGCRWVWSRPDSPQVRKEVQGLYDGAGRTLIVPQQGYRRSLWKMFDSIHQTDWSGREGVAANSLHRTILGLLEQSWYAGQSSFIMSDRRLAEHTLLNRETIGFARTALVNEGFLTVKDSVDGNAFGSQYKLADNLTDKLRPVPVNGPTDGFRPYIHMVSDLDPGFLNECIYGRNPSVPQPDGELAASGRTSSGQLIARPRGVHDRQRIIHPAFHPKSKLDLQVWCLLSATHPADLKRLAAFTGKHVDTVRRSLNKLQAAGLARKDRGWIGIEGEDLLHQLAISNGGYKALANIIIQHEKDWDYRSSTSKSGERSNAAAQAVSSDLDAGVEVDEFDDDEAVEIQFDEDWIGG